LILGYSEIVKRRIIPAIQKIADFSYLGVASFSSAGRVSLPAAIDGEVFDDYDRALSKSSADLVYISTVNSRHAQWVKKSLLSGCHVIVDKPAFLNLKEAEKSIILAKKNSLCLAEATVYAFHPQIDMIRRVVSNQNTSPLRLSTMFSFPPLHPDNFRYSKTLGGGALYDLGPYAVSCGRLFFGSQPRQIQGWVSSRGGKDNLELSFSILAQYPDNRSLVGHFGFDTEYRNCITLLGKDSCLEAERIFTIPVELENELKITEKGQKKILKAPAADCFGLFLFRVLESIQKQDFKEFYDSLFSDAQVLDRLRKSALKERR